MASGGHPHHYFLLNIFYPRTQIGFHVEPYRDIRRSTCFPFQLYTSKNLPVYSLAINSLFNEVTIENITLNTSMPGYVDKARHKYQHPMPKRPVNAPAKFKPIQYGAKVEPADVDTSPQLAKYCIRHIQDVVGTLLY